MNVDYLLSSVRESLPWWAWSATEITRYECSVRLDWCFVIFFLSGSPLHSSSSKQDYRNQLTFARYAYLILTVNKCLIADWLLRNRLQRLVSGGWIKWVRLWFLKAHHEMFVVFRSCNSLREWVLIGLVSNTDVSHAGWAIWVIWLIRLYPGCSIWVQWTRCCILSIYRSNIVPC